MKISSVPGYIRIKFSVLDFGEPGWEKFIAEVKKHVPPGDRFYKPEKIKLSEGSWYIRSTYRNLVLALYTKHFPDEDQTELFKEE